MSSSLAPLPSDDAPLTLFYLALANINKKWTMPFRHWKAALTRSTIQFEKSMPPSTLPQTLARMLHQRRQEILDHAPLAGFDFHRHRHAGAQ